MQKWEYMDLCPDTAAGYATMLREVGEEGWEAACSWVEIEPGSARRINHILYKRPAHVHQFVGHPVAACECGAQLYPSQWQVLQG